MRAVTYDDGEVSVGEEYGHAFHQAGLPLDPDRGSVELGRLYASGIDADKLFYYSGKGDLAEGIRISACTLVQSLPHLTSATAVDLVNGNAFRAKCCEAAGRILFATEWADVMEEEGRGDELSGQNVRDIAPETPDDYLEAGRFLIGLVEGENRATMKELYDRALAAHFPDPSDRAQALVSPILGPTRFAECLALEATGTGVAWSDDATPFEIEIPSLDLNIPVYAEDLAPPTP